MDHHTMAHQGLRLVAVVGEAVALLVLEDLEAHGLRPLLHDQHPRLQLQEGAEVCDFHPYGIVGALNCTEGRT